MKQMDNRQKQQIQSRAQKPSRAKQASEHKEKNIHGQTSAAGDVVTAHEVNQSAPKVGRNDLCPCGSGKKFKKCCLK